MYLMYYLDDDDKRVYTLQVGIDRHSSPGAHRPTGFHCSMQELMLLHKQDCGMAAVSTIVYGDVFLSCRKLRQMDRQHRVRTQPDFLQTTNSREKEWSVRGASSSCPSRGLRWNSDSVYRLGGNEDS